MTKYRVIVPFVPDMGSVAPFVVVETERETRAQAALSELNRMRDHDGLAHLSRMPNGTDYRFVPEFNRKAYMANECSFNEYYGQFVNDWLVRTVGQYIGVEAIKASKDEHFNDIPLRQWDALESIIKGSSVGSAIADSNASTTQGGIRTISLSDTGCVAKVAAQRIRGW